jgi:uncharacterized membrane protein
MSATGLAAVMLVVGTIMLVVSCWRQIAAFMLFIVVSVFCFGVYYVVSTIASIV